MVSELSIHSRFLRARLLTAKGKDHELASLP